MGSGIQHKTVIYLSTLLAVVALSACGEKKEVRGPQPPPEAPKTTTTVKETSNPGGGVALPSPQAPGTTPSPTPARGVPSASKDPQDKGAGYMPVDPRAVDSTDFDKRYTGMSDEDGLFYTGTSTDKLLTYLRLRNDDPNMNAGIKANNVAAAQSIWSAHLSREKSSGAVTISLKIKEGAYLKNYILAGGLSKDQPLSKLRLVKRRNGVQTTGSQNISGQLKCMDDDGGCETIYARLVIENAPTPAPTNGTTASSRAVVAIVFRESLADIHVNLSESSGNPEYEYIREFWRNSQYDANTDMKLKEAVMKSFEVVNGRSGFEVRIVGENRQLISLGGPLLAPEVGTSVDITADRTPQMQQSLDLDGLTGYKLDLANFIGGARIVNNNGLGQVRIALKMRKRVGYDQEAFTLTIMRIIKATQTPDEEHLSLE